MSLYGKPPGYNTISLAGVSKYLPFNNYISGNQRYAPNRPSRLSLNFFFSAAPTNGSQITVPDGPINQPGGPNLKTFTFTYSGSPGAGIIPLVAGGGTAAQAATAAFTALAAQLTNWTVANPTAANMTITSNLRGQSLAPGLVGPTNIAITTLFSSIFRKTLPAAVGRIKAWLTADSNVSS